ncbi:uncharacterized protein LOC110039023 [Phalaenopsis equestris]|uniref:uncharacterized protein LOC110039023 n=1 Tax=Phalaenopsis equestris TaxID=78828 RepID=UPI0009E507E3|nr:uncharacterized protein LOC110039023 [Phalaenopsis equestris]
MEATVMATRYKRAMAPLDAKARARLWEGGRPPTAAAMAVSCRDSTGKLEQLVHAFYEAYHTGDRVEEEEEEEEERLPAKWRQALEAELKDAAVEPAVEWIRNKAEVAVGAAGLECDEVVRRRLVRWMQDGGLDAGICKSRWYNPSGIPAGCHEYIDAVVGDTRYIVEINLAGEFKIARPSEDYKELHSYLPRVFVGSPTTLQAVIGLMCLAAQESIKKAGMHVPPWRRRKYMNQKWFGDYERYTDNHSSSPELISRTGLKAHNAGRRCRAGSGGTAGDGKLVNRIFLRG